MLPVSKPFEVIFFLMYRTFVDKHFFAVPILQILFRGFLVFVEVGTDQSNSGHLDACRSLGQISFPWRPSSCCLSRTCSSWSIFYPGISRLAFIQGPLSSDCHLGRITLLVKIPERYHSVRKLDCLRFNSDFIANASQVMYLKKIKVTEGHPSETIIPRSQTKISRSYEKEFVPN